MNPTAEQQALFINQAEAVFARILDFYGIAWQYEPHTFALEWDSEGEMVEAFTPDFYLPDQNLYIELTTLKPKLSTHKNRKLRRIRELYPDINIKLYKRRELHHLMVKFGLDDEAADIRGVARQESAA